MKDTTREQNERFENDVRHIARALWPSAEFSGATILEGQERDGVFETEDCIHIVEATTSRRAQKAQQDTTRIEKLLNKFQSRNGIQAFRGWLVTRDEPTAEQREATKKYRNKINIFSFAQFQARLIQSNTYLGTRNDYTFGSVRDPATGEKNPNIKYVPLDIVEIESKDALSLSGLTSLISEGQIIVLLGDYGAGKSMTLREIYYDLRKKHLKSETRNFPVYLNLRDHYGQSDPAEIIERHAKLIGFAQPLHLVRAWHAGYVHLLIDGFDEISTINIQGLWRNLQKSRYQAMEGARRLIRDHPSGTGLVITGRAHFFDNPTERRKALALSRGSIEFSLNEFTEDQIKTYLQRAGLPSTVPHWLPSRPLLVGYLAAKGLLRDLCNEESSDHHMSPAVGWDALLDKVADREAQIEAGIDGSTVRRILERLATKTRYSERGFGPLSSDSVTQAFSDICGYKPDERGTLILQRLPSLGVDREEESLRSFIDEEFADACRAGDLVKFVESPFDFDQVVLEQDQVVLEQMESPIGHLGIEVAALSIEKNFPPKKDSNPVEGKINAALAEAQRRNAKYMALDLVRLLLQMGGSVRGENVLSGLMIPTLDFGDGRSDLSKLCFRDCFFSRLVLDREINPIVIPLSGSVILTN